MSKNRSRSFTLLVKITVSLVVISCVFYLIATFFSELNSVSVKKQNIIDVVKRDSDSKFHLSQSANYTVPTPNTGNYRYCEQLVEDHRSDSYSWAKQEYENWTKYLNEGYSLDEVTLAVEYFANPNFAADFRVKQLRITSELASINHQLNERLQYHLTLFPEYDFGQRLVKLVPSPKLKDYAGLPKDKKTLILEQVIPTVDDIAFFMGQPVYSDSDIIELLSAVPDPQATVGYGVHKAISLLDYAVQSSRADVVEKLLELELKPTADSYLGSTMEWALSKLTYANTPEKRQASSNIINMLFNLGAKARFKEKGQSKISGNFPHHFYSFDEKQIEALMQDYGLDLTAIESRDVLLPNKNSALVTILKKQQTAYLSKQLGVDKPDEKIAACEQTLETINNEWKPENSKAILSRVISANPSSPQMVENILADIDPSLIDCYQTKYDGYKRRQERLDNVDRYFRPLRDKNVLAVIDDFLTLPLNGANKNWLFSQILMWDMSYYDELYNSELMVDELQYFSFSNQMLAPKSLNKLTQSNADLHGMDSRGKTLLFYAVKKSDIEMLNYMLEQQFPFSLDDKGQDPLHVALNSDHYRFSPDKVIHIVDILMSYHPKIDQFHLRRMALLKLKYSRLYLQLIDKHPQLRVRPETSLPTTFTSCS